MRTVRRCDSRPLACRGHQRPNGDSPFAAGRTAGRNPFCSPAADTPTDTLDPGTSVWEAGEPRDYGGAVRALRAAFARRKISKRNATERMINAHGGGGKFASPVPANTVRGGIQAGRILRSFPFHSPGNAPYGKTFEPFECFSRKPCSWQARVLGGWGCGSIFQSAGETKYKNRKRGRGWRSVKTLIALRELNWSRHRGEIYIKNCVC